MELVKELKLSSESLSQAGSEDTRRKSMKVPIVLGSWGAPGPSEVSQDCYTSEILELCDFY